MRIVHLFWSFLSVSCLSVLLSAQPARSEYTPESCVVSFLADEVFDRKIQQDAFTLLLQMGYKIPTAQFQFETDGLESLRYCFESGAEDVTIIAHSSEMVPGYHSLLYQSGSISEEPKWKPLDGRIFETLTAHPNLRQITIVSCNSEKLLSNYRSLRIFAQKHRIFLKMQPTSVLGHILTGKSGTRGSNLIGAIIAENSQDTTAAQIYCMISTTIFGITEQGRSSCLRNHFLTEWKSSLAIGMKSAVKFLRFTPDYESLRTQTINLASIEVGFIRGAQLSLSDRPLIFSRESFGLSFSLIQRARLYGPNP